MTKENKYLIYDGYKYDKYIGKRYYMLENMGDDKYKIYEFIIARDKDGKYGIIREGDSIIGEGVMWALNYFTNSGTWSFNPIDIRTIVFSRAHNAFISKRSAKHFNYPINVNEIYRYKNGKKYIGFFYDQCIKKLDKFYYEF